MPTRPLFCGTFFTSQSTVSQASRVSMVPLPGSLRTSSDRLKVPSDLKRPRRFWITKM